MSQSFPDAPHARRTAPLDDWARLERFLWLGCDATTYRAGEVELGSAPAALVARCLAADAPRTLGRIVDASKTGLVPKNDPAIFSLAIAAKLGDDATRAAAYAVLPALCPTAARLMRFVELARRFGGWGRGMRKAVGAWFNARPASELARQLAVAGSHHGWTNRDLIRLAHPRAASPSHDRLFAWTVKGELDAVRSDPELAVIVAIEQLRRTTSLATAARLIAAHRVPRAGVPARLLQHAEVWDALQDAMPLDELLGALPAMTRVGLLAPGAPATARVIARLAEAATGLHPFAVLAALVRYRAGRTRGEVWQPVAAIADTLEAAYLVALAAAAPLGRRVLIALDVSHSMASGSVGGVTGLTPRLASTAMAQLAAATERDPVVVAFTRTPELAEVAIAPRRRPDALARELGELGELGGHGPCATDCARPMRWARDHRVDVDVFVVYTDDETWAGDVPPAEALRQYRDARGIPAKLVVVGMTSNGFALADPDDPGMLDVVGFDASTPPVLADFARA